MMSNEFLKIELLNIFAPVLNPEPSIQTNESIDFCALTLSDSLLIYLLSHSSSCYTSKLIIFCLLRLTPIFSFFPQSFNMLTSIYSMSPPNGGIWDNIDAATDLLACVSMPDGLTVKVPIRKHQTAFDLLCAACKVGFYRNAI